MYKCTNCGRLMDEPSIEENHLTNDEHYALEEMCPFCHNYVYFVNTCKECGVEINDDEEYCEKCRR